MSYNTLMPAVDCPECGRALKPPESGEPLSVRCPLCGHIFTIDNQAVLPFPSSRVVPLESATGLPRLRDADRAALARLGAWLNRAGAVILASICLQGCMLFAGLVPFLRQDYDGKGTMFCSLCLVGQGIAAALMLAGAPRVYDVGGNDWVWLPVQAARCLGFLHLFVGPLGLVTALPIERRPFDRATFILSVASLAVCVVGLLAARAYDRAVARPAIRKLLEHVAE